MKKTTQKLLLGVCALLGFSLFSTIIKKSDLNTMAELLPSCGSLPETGARSSIIGQWLFTPQQKHSYVMNLDSVIVYEKPETEWATVHHRTCDKCGTYNVDGNCGYAFIQDDTKK